MLDNNTFYLPIKVPISDFGSAHEICFNGCNLSKFESNRTHQIYYGGYYKNLSVRLFETGVYVSNSISSFIYNHNANDLNLNQIEFVIDKICSFLDCKTKELIVKDIEFGFTIGIGINTSSLLKRFISHKSVEAKREYRGPNLTGIKFYHTEYSIKCYDKARLEKLTRRHNIPGNWLRIEMKLKRRKLKKHVRNASDLLNKDTVEIIFAEFINQWKQIIKHPFFNHNEFSKNEIYKIYAQQTPLYFEDRLDFVSKEAVKKEKQRSKAALKHIGDYSIFDTIEQTFSIKFQELINNSNIPSFPPLLLAGNRGQNKF